MIFIKFGEAYAAVADITAVGVMGYFAAGIIATLAGVSLAAGAGILVGGVIGAVAVIGGLAIGISAIFKAIANKIRNNKVKKASKFIDKSKEAEKGVYENVESKDKQEDKQNEFSYMQDKNQKEKVQPLSKVSQQKSRKPLKKVKFSSQSKTAENQKDNIK